MRISARSDYAIRAMAELAAASPLGDRPVKAEELAQAQDIPVKFLLEILRELRNDQLVISQRGAVGGYALARPADQITLADVMRALEGPLVTVHETSLSELEYRGAAESLVDVWMATRSALRRAVRRLRRRTRPPPLTGGSRPCRPRTHRWRIGDARTIGCGGSGR